MTSHIRHTRGADSALKRITLGLCLTLLTACAGGTEPKNASGIHDPYEDMNRAVFAFNKVVDRNLLDPVVTGYNTVVPEPARDGVSNAMRNLREPWTFLNDLLQGNFGRAGTALGRFVINTTLGIGGLFRVSDEMGIKYHNEDLGQTLAVWGVDRGPYLVLPLLGPSSVRDGAGTVTSFWADPVSIAADRANEKGLQLGLVLTNGLSLRADNDGLIDSLYQEDDPYIFMRSTYRQNREFQIRNGKRAKEPSEADAIFDALEEEDGG
ncbi:MlaA family lipoprotein [Yunchengibacter salinarum]|uniref:MlaA family lipoprotein n=1 Tax=Yunchengibacter salinarum TaxID=3133399 RepID=UPI0035B6747B